VREPDHGDGTFATFLRAMSALSTGMRTPGDLAGHIRKMAKEAAADGMVWLEPSTSIRQGLADQLGLPDRMALMELLLDAAQTAERETGVGIGYVLTANRTHPPQEAVDLAQIAARYAGRGVVGFGLADDEMLGPAEAFAEAFAIAREAGLISAPHAGELLGPESVHAALEALGARRIQHGVRAIEDANLVRRLAEEQICLDVCPTSNVALGVVASLAEHPLPALVAAGVPVSLNADCPSIFGCTAADEYALARREFAFDDATLARIAEASIAASGAPPTLRASAVAGIRAWLTR
jgi:adenosine deaminase